MAELRKDFFFFKEDMFKYICKQRKESVEESRGEVCGREGGQIGGTKTTKKRKK